MVSFYFAIHCATLYVAFFLISIWFGSYKAFCENFLEGAKNSLKMLFFPNIFHDCEQTRLKIKKKATYEVAHTLGEQNGTKFFYVAQKL